MRVPPAHVMWWSDPHRPAVRPLVVGGQPVLVWSGLHQKEASAARSIAREWILSRSTETTDANSIGLGQSI
jgi:hypothetical protein